MNLTVSESASYFLQHFGQAQTPQVVTEEWTHLTLNYGGN